MASCPTFSSWIFSSVIHLVQAWFCLSSEDKIISGDRNGYR